MDVFELWKLYFEEDLVLDLKQHSDYNSLIAKNFDGNTLKMEAVNTI